MESEERNGEEEKKERGKENEGEMAEMKAKERALPSFGDGEGCER